MNEADASNFFRRRSRRGVKSQDEITGEFTLGFVCGSLDSGLASQGGVCGCVFGVIVGICVLLYRIFSLLCHAESQYVASKLFLH